MASFHYFKKENLMIKQLTEVDSRFTEEVANLQGREFELPAAE